jgi:hypothetical protein
MRTTILILPLCFLFSLPGAGQQPAAQQQTPVNYDEAKVPK